MDKIKNEEDDNAGLPAFIKTWNRFYFLLVFWLLALIAGFYGFMRYFSN